MSAPTEPDRPTRTGVVGRVVAAVEHPLLGRRPRRTWLALGGLALLVALHLASYLASREVAGVRAQTLSTSFDELSALVIATTLVVVMVGPLCYAVWNGGPALSFTIPIVPVAFGELVAPRYVLDVDAAVALTTGVAGAALALYATEVAGTRTMRPWRHRRPDSGATLFVAAVVVGSAVAVARFLLVAPTRLVDAYVPFAVGWLVVAAVGGAYGVDWLRRRGDRSRAADEVVDSQRS